MSKLKWGQVGDNRFEQGVDRGVLYPRSLTDGEYLPGVPWNGLVSITQSPSGAEPNKQYADNKVYLNLISAEEYAATIEAFTYPEEFEACDGTAEVVPGVTIGQQTRQGFGLSWRSRVGNEVNPNLGYKIHILWGGLAAPSESVNSTINDSPEAQTLSWEVSTTPTEVNIPGFIATASATIDSTRLTAAELKELEDLLYGTDGTPGGVPTLPTPEELFDLLGVTGVAG